MPVLEKPEPRSAADERASLIPVGLKLETVSLVFLGFVGAVFFLRYAQAILVPFVLALLLFYVLDPIVGALQRWSVPRVVGCLLLYFILIGTGVTAIYLVRDQAASAFDRLPEALEKAKAAIESHRTGSPGAVAKVQEAAGALQKTASASANTPDDGVTRVRIEEPLFKTSDYLLSGSKGLVWFVGEAFTILLLVFFLLASGDLYKRKLVEVVGPRLSRQRLTLEILNDIDQQIGRFLLIQVATSAFIGTAVGFGMWIVGVNQAAMWGIAAGVLNFVPYFGTIIITTALFLVAFLQFGKPEMAALAAAVTLFITSIDGFLLKTLLTGRFSKMNSVAVFLSLIFWGWLWGPMGMLLSVPIMMVIKSICDHLEVLQPIGHLLGEGK